MNMQVVPFAEKYLEDAAALFAQRYRLARELNPRLAPDYESGSALLPRLGRLVGDVPAVAALQGGRLVGFLAAYLLDELHGEQAVYSPEWANAADGENARWIYQAMYAELAAGWVKAGYRAHYLSVLASESRVIETLHWMNFGMMAVDAVRDLTPIEAGDAGVDIREATSGDVQDIVSLNQELGRYMASSPVFMVVEECDARHYEEWLADSDNHLWLAYRNDEAVGYIQLQKWIPDACTVTQDARSVSITGAFTRERCRGGGVGTALLNQALSWARSMGFARCAVDFEPHNPLATAFWLRRFAPVCYSVVRHVDRRIG